MRDYSSAIAWVIRERGGGGGHPPQFVAKVIGWKTVQLIAFLYQRHINEVAADVVAGYSHLDAIIEDVPEEMP
jgi:hypothetical protein